MITPMKTGFNHLVFKFLVVISGILICIIPGKSQPAQPEQGYQTYDELTHELQVLVKAHPDLARLESIGTSAEGRDIWLLTLAKKGSVPTEERPGLLIAANFEAGHLIGSRLSMAMAEQLVRGYQENDNIKQSLDNHVFYIIPRMNPDGAESWFSKLLTGQKGNNRPADADNDGRMDEDGPEDLNGDGVITVMRVKDPHGLFMLDPADGRLLKRADAAKGETGVYSIYLEGIDNDGDGFINEDPVGGTDLNRNFQHAYPYFKEDAGRYMVSEPESRTLMDWVISHRNVAMVLTFGESDNLIVPPSSRGQLSTDRPLDLISLARASVEGASRVGMISMGGRGFDRYSMMMMGSRGRSGGQGATPESTGRQRPSREPATTVNQGDIEYFSTISSRYKELTGIQTQPVLRNPEGAFFQYAYYHYGVPAFSTPGWGITLPADSTRRSGARGSMARPGGSDNTSVMPGGMARGGQFPIEGSSSSTPGIDAQFLKYLDSKNIQGFVNWEKATHPEFGEVEIGGFKPLEISNPPIKEIDKLAESHTQFALYLSTLYARIQIVDTEVTSLGGGLFMVRAEIANEGFLPTALKHGVQSRSVKPTMVQLGVAPEQIISGSSKTNFFQTLDGSGRRVKYEWMVKGKSGEKIELKAVSQKAGSDVKTITLK